MDVFQAELSKETLNRVLVEQESMLLRLQLQKKSIVGLDEFLIGLIRAVQTRGLYEENSVGREQFQVLCDGSKRIRKMFEDIHSRDYVEAALRQRKAFDRTTQQGVTFNLIGAVAEFGKLGIVSIAHSPAEAELLYYRTVHALDIACE